MRFVKPLKAAGGPSEAAVFGVLSLVFWAIILVVAIKYVVFVMKADNEGEGGDDGAPFLSPAGRREVADRPPTRGARRGVGCSSATP